MSKKQSLLAALNRCRAVVQDEVALLDVWQNSPGVTVGRAAECQIARRFLSIGQTSPLATTSLIISNAETLHEGDLKGEPSTQSIKLIKHLEGDHQSRSTLSPAQFTPGPNGELQFELTLDMARDNGLHAADCAAATFHECLSPGPEPN